MTKPTHKTLTCDVLIVGGGPAGLATAQTLAPHAKTIVIHQDREIGKPVRTSGGTWVEDMEALGVPSHLYQQIDEILFRSDNREVRQHLERRKCAVLDITGTYQWLADLARNAGADIYTDTKFLHTVETDDGFISEIRSRSIDATRIKSRFIIDASGTPHAVLADLGLVDKPDRVGVGIEHEFEIKSADKNRAALFVGQAVKSGYGWIFPAPNNHIRIGVGIIQPVSNLSPRDIYNAVVTPEFLESYGLELGPPVQVNAGIIPSVPYDPKLVFGNVIRVGDTANFATPTVGEGIRIAIKFGRILGERLSETLAQGCRSPLVRYELECRKALKRNYSFGFTANERIATYDADDWDKSLDRLSRLDEDEVVSLVKSEFTLSMMIKAVGKQVRHKLFG
ncbi:NAD(P)/FAD-dependent oxidoreductase [Celeribacter sp.]|uniref:NAD(P)/FAD-dependent oxidoreductase n=1 Tax=Celeribacter sp. TaxID=1890673 RepID=UPI003A9220A9